MLRKPSPQQTELEMVTLEQLVPGDHLLRKVDAAIDFGFIREPKRHEGSIVTRCRNLSVQQAGSSDR